MARLEAFRAAAFRDDLREINRRLAKEMGITLARLKQLVDAGEIKTVESGPRARRIPWCEVQHWMGEKRAVKTHLRVANVSTE